MKYIYGPVPSWRLGRSLGIDLISEVKACTFDCVYCQLGNLSALECERKVFNPTQSILQEFDSLHLNQLEIDYITFSGMGEPTLALNIAEVAREIKKRTKIPIALLTNSTLLHDEAVRKDLINIDKIIAKLDAPNDEILKLTNQSAANINFTNIIEGIKKAQVQYPDKLALQIMFVPQNIKFAANLAKLAKEIDPIEVALNTPLRKSQAAPISKEEMEEIKPLFSPLKVISVYDQPPVSSQPLDEKDVLRRRPEK